MFLRFSHIWHHLISFFSLPMHSHSVSCCTVMVINPFSLVCWFSHWNTTSSSSVAFNFCVHTSPNFLQPTHCELHLLMTENSGVTVVWNLQNTGQIYARGKPPVGVFWETNKLVLHRWYSNKVTHGGKPWVTSINVLINMRKNKWLKPACGSAYIS